MIKIQKKEFNIEDEISLIKSKHSNVGAVSTFIGFVRDFNDEKIVESINLEVYKEMAFKSLTSISSMAQKKWHLIDSLVIHRYGNLLINDKIVLVATFAMHRENSMDSCNYIMEYLKKDAPFWKKEFYKNSSAWL